MIRHRRELHFRTRDKLPEGWKSELSACDDVTTVIDVSEDNEYLCVLGDRSLEWRKMKESDERVVKFRTNRAAYVSNNLYVIDSAD